MDKITVDISDKVKSLINEKKLSVKMLTSMLNCTMLTDLIPKELVIPAINVKFEQNELWFHIFNGIYYLLLSYYTFDTFILEVNYDHHNIIKYSYISYDK